MKHMRALWCVLFYRWVPCVETESGASQGKRAEQQQDMDFMLSNVARGGEIK